MTPEILSRYTVSHYIPVAGPGSSLRARGESHVGLVAYML
jgi:hypothetical protein